MKITTLEGTLEYISTFFMKRELSGNEILMIGIAFQNGILRGVQEQKEKEKGE